MTTVKIWTSKGRGEGKEYRAKYGKVDGDWEGGRSGESRSWRREPRQGTGTIDPHNRTAHGTELGPGLLSLDPRGKVIESSGYGDRVTMFKGFSVEVAELGGTLQLGCCS